jgi:pSer/pThr/pTyr-binding forkhead associated (FHA) protein
MKARLLCPVGKFGGKKLEIAKEVVIGRRGCDLELDDGSISARHARIYPDPASGTWMLEDLGSTNGTLLAGIPVEAPERLGALDVVNFAGICDFVFCVVGDGAASKASTPAAAVKPVTPAPTPKPAPPPSSPEEGKTTFGFEPMRPAPAKEDRTIVEPPTPAAPPADATRMEPFRPAPPPKDEPGEKTMYDPNFPKFPKQPDDKS